MCLLAVAWECHPRYALVLAGNRDEFFARPSAPAAWWSDNAQVLAGRDLTGDGTWLGVNRAGSFAVITNLPGAGAASPVRSRGALVSEFLTGSAPAVDYVKQVADAGRTYAGFNLLAGSPGQLWLASNASDRHRPIPAGVITISNSPPEVEWPKARWLKQALADMLMKEDADDAQYVSSLLDTLGQSSPVNLPGESPAPESGALLNEAARFTPFVALGDYGTRASTVLLVGIDGSIVFAERCFDAGGNVTCDTQERFHIGEGIE